MHIQQKNKYTSQLYTNVIYMVQKHMVEIYKSLTKSAYNTQCIITKLIHRWRRNHAESNFCKLSTITLTEKCKYLHLISFPSYQNFSTQMNDSFTSLACYPTFEKSFIFLYTVLISPIVFLSKTKFIF